MSKQKPKTSNQNPSTTRSSEIEILKRKLAIEAALDKVRERTMKMKTSEELPEVALVLWEQLDGLKLKELPGCAIHVNDDAKGTFDAWGAFPEVVDGKMEMKLNSGTHNQQCIWMFREWYKNYRAGKSTFTAACNKTQLNEFIDWFEQYLPLLAEEMRSWKLEKLYLNGVAFSNGIIGAHSLEPLSMETWSVLKKLTGVFDMAYRRFEDLKKAEEQAKDAAIEVALERVRSRTMAMQESHELKEVIQTVYDQLVRLNINVEHAGFIVDYQVNDNMNIWLADQRGVPSQVTIPYFDTPHWNGFIKAKENGEDFFITTLGFKEKNKFYRQLFKHIPSLDEETKKFYFDCEGLAISTALMDNIGLYVENFSGIPYSEEENGVVRRFGKVFQQTYTRFLDLQKAEEQAREALVEAAIERVRARSMSMQHSDEILEILQLIFKELTGPGVELARCILWTFNVEDRSVTWWSANPESQTIDSYLITDQVHPVYKTYWKEYQNRNPRFRYELSGKNKESWDQVLFTSTELVKMPEKVKQGMISAKKVYLSNTYHNFGVLFAATLEPFPDQYFEVLERFGKVFDQSFTRFQDIQKAEEQAREAQIEAALERVRARAMAMYRSGELKEVIAIIYQELTGLGLELQDTNIAIQNPETKEITFWGSGLGGVDLPPKFTIPYLKQAVVRKVYDHGFKDGPYFWVKLKGRELKNFVRIALTQTEFKDAPKEYQEAMTSLDPLFLSQVAIKHGFLEVASGDVLSKEQASILQRFASVVDLTYTRFDDVLQAEEQAREAQIEAALERVRARAMAMHASEELYEVALVLRQEMGLLGQPDLEASVVHLYPEGSETFESWYAMRPPGKREGKIVQGVAKFRYDESEVGKECLKAFKAKDKEYTMVARGAKLKEWLDQLAQQAPEIIKYFKGELPEQHVYHYSDFSGGSLLMVTHTEPTDESKILQQRAAKVFDLAYKRFLDLKKAEEQAREAEIELALERIRARTMAMQHSDELADASLLLAQQAKALGIKTWGCAFHIYDEGSNTATEWFSNDQAALPTYKLKREKIFLEYYQQGRKGEKLYIKTFEGKACQKHYQYLCTLPGVGEALLEMKAQGIPFPTFQIDHVAYFKYGHLLFITFEPVPEAHSIFERFATVFQQTYTRFLDLRKAEEQAREAEIELALERVRARTMALQHSDELADASFLLVQQVKALGIETWGCAFNIWDENSDSATEWFSNDEGILTTYEQKRKGIFQKYYNIGKSGETLHIEEFKGQKCKKHYEYMCSLPVVGEALAELQAKGVPLPTYQLDNVAYFKYGYVLFVTFKPVPESHDIFRRFAKVFEQTYVRFLDLKRAEEQAREAQIEAALERVRARTMAMHKGEELAETAMLLFEQITELGIKPRGCGFLIMDEKTKSMEDWSANINEKGKASLVTGTLTFDQHPIISAVVDTWQEGAPYFIGEIHGKELQDYYRAVTSMESTSKTIQDKVLSKYQSEWTNSFYFDYGMMYALTPYAISQDEINILLRFASVFKLTYRRFLDLKKAEEQAREAQIEAALERVRSRTMGMQKSEELTEVAMMLGQEFRKLGYPKLFEVGYIKWDEELNLQKGWLSDFHGKSMGPFTLPLKGDWVLDERYHAWKTRKQLLYQEIGGKQLLDHASFCLPSISQSKVKKQVKEHFSDPTHFYHSFFKEGALCVILQQALDDENQVLLRRFTRVFEQTYTRFLDLKKAEEQARESQIEAALERVRTRTLLMHDSGELNDAVGVFFKEFQNMGLLPDEARTYFCHIDGEKDMAEVWMTKADGTVMSGSHQTPLTKSASMKQFYEAWQRGTPIMERKYTGKALQDYLAFVSSLSHVKRDRDYQKIFRSPPKRIVMTDANFLQGNIGIMTFKPLSQEATEVLKRFAKVFEFTYTRFLDLKKAELQAREEQIEVALERIRARALAMHSSEELVEVANVIREQMHLLGQPQLQSAAIHMYPEEGDIFESWLSFQPKGKSNKIITKAIPFNKRSTKLAREMLRRYKSDLNVYTMHVRGKSFEEWREMSFRVNPEIAKYWGKDIPKQLYWHFTDFSGGSFVMISHEPPTEEVKALQVRVSATFDLAYRRFQDLKQAEEQAREAQIEAALERVRASTMAMQHSEKMLEVGALLYHELSKLGIDSMTSGITLVDNDGKTDWYYMVEPGSMSMMKVPMGIPRDETKVMRSLTHSWEKQEPYHLVALNEKDTISHQTYIAENSINFEYTAEKLISVSPKRLTLQTFNFKQGYLLLVGGDKLSQDKIDILIRFAKVFEQTYTRFQDLQKAEEQAREAQIEAALERVRAAAMAMHSSNDLFSVAEVLHDQFAPLWQEELESSIIHIYHEDLPTFDAWYSYRSTEGKSKQVMDRALIPKDSCSWAKKVVELYKSDETSYTIESKGEMLRGWYQVMAGGVAPDVVEYHKNGHIKVPEVLYYNFSKFSGGALLMVSNDPPGEEARDMQRRAAAVFDLAYRRFLDLQKAERQARESQIEAALERVRASTMAMHSSEDVGKATAVLFQELDQLGIEMFRCGIAIFKDNLTTETWTASNFAGDMVFDITGTIDMTVHPLLKQLYASWKSDDKIFSYELKGKDVERYYKAIRSLTSFKLPTSGSIPNNQFCTGFLFKEGALYAFSKERFNEEHTQIFQKFTNVFTLTYRRYLDLKEAEARAAAAVLKSSLDRVRAEIASMRNTDDLQRITPLVWRELRSLGVPFFRCGVFIMDETNQMVHMYLSTPSGDPLAAVDLGFDEQEIPMVKDAIAHWKTQSVHKTHWNRQEFKTFTESLKKRGLIKSLKTYQQGEQAPKSLNLHQVPFKQGMLYVGSSELLADDQIELVHSLAEAFSVAYARYEDFVELEEAKQSVENTLAELKSAQDQLIHSEKMASLGELTAGIAHEIQNPLNFVNNFSEVSNELLEEVKEEIEEGNHEEVAELVEDLIQNLDKIAHHGKRASGIVKGMLDHSRASSDVKVLTDVNALADEYLRLAYHGFRAKDKSFTANFKADLADDLPKIDIVSQDIGRVILNLVNNAFQAVKEVEDPEVTIKTQMEDGNVLIIVKDNGTGIPDEIREKIFQPFFTTKAAGEGTGLGLSLSYDIVNKGHGGKIEVNSEVGEGTEFRIMLPIES